MKVRLVVRLLERMPVGKLVKYFLWRADRVAYVRAIGVTIGERCRIYSRMFGTEPYLIRLGSHVHVGERVQFITHDGGVWVLRELLERPKLDFFGEICIGNNVFIGNDSIVMPGVTIGDNVVIGAGSVVTKDVDSNSIWAGVPARRLKGIEAYLKKADVCVETKGMAPCERERAIRAFCRDKTRKQSGQ